MQDYGERPNRLPWPPIIYLATILATLVLQAAVPYQIDPAWGWRAAGAGLLAAGIGLDLAAIFTLLHSRTTFRPDRGSAHLVTGGPYAISRNPIYLGNTMALLGVAVALDQPWLVALLPFGTFAVQKLAIEREERHLAAVFGADWDAYRQRVRRWI
ncbi:MAG: isoprenylcysteine carboxylmethyltransferase family protein [Hyphomicrobiaceae bacterium]